MQIINIEQRTEEWHELRRSKIGASACPAIMGKSPYATAVDIWEQMVLHKKQKVTPAMQRGSDLEEEARKYFNAQNKSSFSPAVVVSDEYPFMMASLDGIDFTDKTILEIKVPGASTFDKTSDGEIPEYWIWQIQHQLSVTGYDKATLFIYNGTDGVSFEIERNADMIAQLVEKEKDFYFNNVLEFVCPEIESTFVERSDEEWQDAVQAWKAAKAALEEAEELEKICREGLIYLSNDSSSRGCGLKLSKVYKKGNVDYSKIEALKGVDLNLYRKSPTEYWKITKETT